MCFPVRSQLSQLAGVLVCCQKSLNFLSDEYEDMRAFCASTRKELSSISSRLSSLEETADKISKAIEDSTKYSYQYNVKLVGVPHVNSRETAAETSNLCCALFNAIGADISPLEIDIAHRVPTRAGSDEDTKPIICKFVRRLAKEKVMTKRNELAKLVPGVVAELPEDCSLESVRIYDHLTPITQNLYSEAKKFQQRHNFAFCWIKGDNIFLRNNNDEIINNE